MIRWSRKREQAKNRGQKKAGLALELLEDRTVPTVPGLTVAAGYDVTPFAVSPSGTSQPDSIAVDASNIYVGYQNGVAKDGSDGKSSTIVQYNIAGGVVQTFSVLGHNDGLKVDPTTHLLWALQNEDANPNLAVINTTTKAITLYTFDTPLAGGGFDDITFVGGKVFLSESNPANNPNNQPAVVQVTLSGTKATVTTVLLGNATATNAVHGVVGHTELARSRFHDV